MGRCETVFFNSGLNGALDGAARLPLGHATGGRPSSALPAAHGRFYAAWRVRSRKLESVAKVAYRKLAILHSAAAPRDLKSPGLQLEALREERAGQHSIRVNDRYRICFEWRDGKAADVEIVDYH